MSLKSQGLELLFCVFNMLFIFSSAPSKFISSPPILTWTICDLFIINWRGISNPRTFIFRFFLDPELEGLPNNRGSKLSNTLSFIFSNSSGFLFLINLVIPSEGIFLEKPRSLPSAILTPRSFSEIGRLFLYSSEFIRDLYNLGSSFFKDSNNILLYKSSPSYLQERSSTSLIGIGRGWGFRLSTIESTSFWLLSSSFLNPSSDCKSSYGILKSSPPDIIFNISSVDILEKSLPNKSSILDPISPAILYSCYSASPGGSASPTSSWSSIIRYTSRWIGISRDSWKFWSIFSSNSYGLTCCQLLKTRS